MVKEFKGTSISLELPICFFREDGQVISICPSIDISASGRNEREALIALNESIEDLIQYTNRNWWREWGYERTRPK